MKELWVEYEGPTSRVGMILPIEQGFQEAKDALDANITKFIYLKVAGSRIKWFMHKVGPNYMLNGKLISQGNKS